MAKPAQINLTDWRKKANPWKLKQQKKNHADVPVNIYNLMLLCRWCLSRVWFAEGGGGTCPSWHSTFQRELRYRRQSISIIPRGTSRTANYNSGCTRSLTATVTTLLTRLYHCVREIKHLRQEKWSASAHFTNLQDELKITGLIGKRCHTKWSKVPTLPWWRQELELRPSGLSMWMFRELPRGL